MIGIDTPVEQVPAPRRGRHRISRWDFEQFLPVPGVPKFLPKGLSEEEEEAFIKRARLEELNYALSTGQLCLESSRARSPSPEPVYDTVGKRINTRQERVRAQLAEERSEIVQECKKIYPSFTAPADFNVGPIKKIRKMVIPEKEYPDYNFIGLIIGPRGNTQKRFEKESGAKISIRGRGSVKEGKQRKGGPLPDDEEALHVLVTADTDEQLKKACELLEPLLVPVDEERNEWKKAQLRELAEINGTLRDRNWFQPPENYDYAANVTCSICGEESHATVDCPLKGKGMAPVEVKRQQQMDMEYGRFLDEIGVRKEGVPSRRDGSGLLVDARFDAQRSYEEFMSAIEPDVSEFVASEQHRNMMGSGAPAPWQAVPPPPGAYPGAPAPPQFPPAGQSFPSQAAAPGPGMMWGQDQQGYPGMAPPPQAMWNSGNASGYGVPPGAPPVPAAPWMNQPGVD